MVMLFICQKVSYTQFNFPAEVYPKIAGVFIFALGFAPIFWRYFTLQMHYMYRKNAFMAGKGPTRLRTFTANFHAKTSLLLILDTHPNSAQF
jgi:hypothetical protein